MAGFQIVAEAAQGYEGKPALAALLVRAAAAAGADAVKFQLVYASELATYDYQHYALFGSLEMPDAEWHSVKRLADELRVALYLDVFGSRSLALAQALGCLAVKVHSTDMANIGLLQEIAASQVPTVLLSCAGCTDAAIREALALVRTKDVVLLHGFQGYPTPVEANDILRLTRLAALIPESGAKGVTGFADHAPADDPTRFLLPAAALGAGARLIEKHLTLSKVMKLEDHESALAPDEFAEFVQGMRACCAALGTGESVHASELAYRDKTRKHVVALRDIEAGTAIEPRMVGLLRTSAPEAIHDARLVYGKRARTRIAGGCAIAPSMVEP